MGNITLKATKLPVTYLELSDMNSDVFSFLEQEMKMSRAKDFEKRYIAIEFGFDLENCMISEVIATVQRCKDEIENFGSFFAGIKTINKDTHDMIVSAGYPAFIDTNETANKVSNGKKSQEMSMNANGLMTKVIKTNVRGGQSIIEENYNLVIEGSINNGAEVISGGSIVILGSLNGKAMAGFKDHNSYIIAQDFNPELISINGIFDNDGLGEYRDKPIFVNLNSKEECLIYKKI
jgi:septum site-determining protein MinC